MLGIECDAILSYKILWQKNSSSSLEYSSRFRDLKVNRFNCKNFNKTRKSRIFNSFSLTSKYKWLRSPYWSVACHLATTPRDPTNQSAGIVWAASAGRGSTSGRETPGRGWETCRRSPSCHIDLGNKKNYECINEMGFILRVSITKIS